MASGNTRNFELKLGKTGLIIVVVGMVVLLCCTFLLGVDVGKNIDTYPGKIVSLPQKLLALVWRPSKIKVASVASGGKSAQNQSKTQEELDLTFYNTLTSKKGAVSEKPIPDKKPVVETPEIKQMLPPSKSETGLSSVSPDSGIKKRQTVNERSSGDEIEAKIKEAEQTAAAREAKFSVQVASLKEKTKASQMGKKVSALGYTPRVVENNIPGKGRWFRVVIDGFESKTMARAAAEKISRRTGTSCIIRRSEVAASNN
jgi:cell division protein FtsN